MVKRLAAKADALIEGFRPGVMERLGLGPDELLQRSTRKLVFGRMTGFGQDGPLAQRAGHDINYIALAGVLHAIGRKGEAPVPPLNLVGDFGGGGMFLAFGVVCALLEAQKSGKGQVVDAAMVDGAAYLMALIYGLLLAGHLGRRARRQLPRYRRALVRRLQDQGRQVAGGRRHRAALLRGAGRASGPGPGGAAQAARPQGLARAEAPLRAAIAGKTRDEWERIFEGSDACVAPVLALGEVASPSRTTGRAPPSTERDGVLQPAPAPRFSRTVRCTWVARRRSLVRTPMRCSATSVSRPARSRS